MNDILFQKIDALKAINEALNPSEKEKLATCQRFQQLEVIQEEPEKSVLYDSASKETDGNLTKRKPQNKKLQVAQFELFQALQLPSTFKKIMFYIHQNFLLLSQIILGRLPKQSKNNVWAHSLLA